MTNITLHGVIIFIYIFISLSNDILQNINEQKDVKALFAHICFAHTNRFHTSRSSTLDFSAFPEKWISSKHWTGEWYSRWVVHGLWKRGLHISVNFPWWCRVSNKYAWCLIKYFSLWSYYFSSRLTLLSVARGKARKKP